MATFLDLGILQYFDFIFPMLLVFAIVFAILQKTKVIGDTVGINSLIAIAVAFMMLLSRTLIDMINFMIPWFVIAIIFFVLIILLFQIMGAKEADFSNAIKDRTLRNAIIGVALVILMASFAHVLGQSFTEFSFEEGADVIDREGGSATSDFTSNITQIIVNPKVLGLITIFGIAIFAVALLTAKEQ
ncbi:MAG: hypothetical protein KKH52_00290 [Nanoarchaeota archaeon]|nr:hypothetical protein [Nanoarchaeota archaeon]